MDHPLTITAYSTALYSTWIFIEEFRLLLDAGDGVCAGLLGKSRKIDWVAVTHADRDHLTGLFQLQQLNARDGKPQIFYPRDAASFPNFAEFCRRFDPNSGNEITWSPIEPWQSYPLSNHLRIEALPNNHVQQGDLVKSVSYRVMREKQKLKPEYHDLPQAEITHGEAITKAFYDELFTAHPELLNMFNLANQRDGGQARSLAASILSYAAHINHLEALGGMVERIAHKHASLYVLPEQYPIVGKHLLSAICMVLGAAATDEIIDAWAAAYGQLADIMIGRESDLYTRGNAVGRLERLQTASRSA